MESKEYVQATIENIKALAQAQADAIVLSGKLRALTNVVDENLRFISDKQKKQIIKELGIVYDATASLDYNILYNYFITVSKT